VQHGVGAGGSMIGNKIYVGLDADATGRLIQDAVHPVLHLTRFEAQTEREATHDSVTSLLSAYRADVVSPLGREALEEDFSGWVAREQDISIRVLTGGAGRGKTRFAIELARLFAKKGWLAGFVTAEALDRFRTQPNVADWVWKAPTLVVVDYAGSRANQLRDWIAELVDRKGGVPLRLLLLERQASRETGWLSTVLGLGADGRSRAAHTLLDSAGPIELPKIDNLSARRAIFAALLERHRPDLSAPAIGTDPAFDKRLRDEKWAGDPLFLMMAGIVAGEIGFENALSLGSTDLVTNIARRELDRIAQMALPSGNGAHGRRQSGLLAKHGAVLATLAQGLSLADARLLIADEAVRLGSSEDINEIIMALSDTLPSSGELRGIAPITPDIVGEAAIMLWFGSGGALPNLGIAPQASIDRVARAAPSRVSQVLVRTTQDFAPAGHDEPAGWLSGLVRATDPSALFDISNQIPDQTLALREVAADVARRIADHLRGTLAGRSEKERASLAKSLMNLGIRLSGMGRHEDALRVSQEAVDLRRQLAEACPDAYLQDLGFSLSNLAGHLIKLGRGEDATRVAEEAVGIRRRLATSGADHLLTDLATSLGNLGGILPSVGRLRDAVSACEESVELYRRLGKSSPEAFLPKLAGGLANLSNSYSALQRHEDALAAGSESARIFRRFAKTRPDAFLYEFALSLNNLDRVLGNVNRHKEALVASREAVEILRRLAASQPEAFLSDLARSMSNMAKTLYDLRRRKEAVETSQEAVATFRRIAETRPESELLALAESLYTLGFRLAALARHREALVACQEAVEINRRLAETPSDVFLPGLAQSLRYLAGCFVDIGRREEALAAGQEAVSIYRRLAEMSPNVFARELAETLYAVGHSLAIEKRHREAAAATRDGLAAIAPLVERDPRAFGGLALSLGRDHLDACEVAGAEADTALIRRVALVLDPRGSAGGRTRGRRTKKKH
jgi:tetratricopeptide (TPR) repeat protein